MFKSEQDYLKIIFQEVENKKFLEKMDSNLLRERRIVKLIFWLGVSLLPVSGFLINRGVINSLILVLISMASFAIVIKALDQLRIIASIRTHLEMIELFNNSTKEVLCEKEI